MGSTRALVTTAPALLIGNVHRLWLYRDRLDRRVAGLFIAGALPGALIGGLLAVAVPLVAIHALMVFATALAVARALELFTFRPPSAAIAPAALGIGALCATSSGAGLLTSPVLLAAGLTGEAYIATSSATAAAMHLGRLSGYGLGGIVTIQALTQAGVLGASILVGNLIGDRARGLLTAKSSRTIEITTLVACVTLAIAGL